MNEGTTSLFVITQSEGDVAINWVEPPAEGNSAWIAINIEMSIARRLCVARRLYRARRLCSAGGSSWKIKIKALKLTMPKESWASRWSCRQTKTGLWSFTFSEESKRLSWILDWSSIAYLVCWFSFRVCGRWWGCRNPAASFRCWGPLRLPKAPPINGIKSSMCKTVKQKTKTKIENELLPCKMILVMGELCLARQVKAGPKA